MEVNILFLLTLIIVFNISIFFYKRFAIRFNYTSFPKKRDSHTGIVPKGCGIIFFIILYAYSLNEYLNYTNDILFIKMVLVITPAITLFSFIDDKYNINWKFKITVDFLSGLLFIYFLNKYLLFNNLFYNFLLICLIIFFIVWFINLINFTDGSDGYLTTFLIYLLIINILFKYLAYNEINNFNVIFLFLLINFLFYNIATASIFMGDSGSRFFSIILMINIINDLINKDLWIIEIWIISSMLILVDTCYTLIYRFLTLKKWMKEHKEHAYQIITFKYGHNTSLLWLIFNLLFITTPILYLFNSLNLSYLLAALIILITSFIQVFYIKHILINKII